MPYTNSETYGVRIAFTECHLEVSGLELSDANLEVEVHAESGPLFAVSTWVYGLPPEIVQVMQQSLSHLVGCSVPCSKYLSYTELLQFQGRLGRLVELLSHLGYRYLDCEQAGKRQVTYEFLQGIEDALG